MIPEVVGSNPTEDAIRYKCYVDINNRSDQKLFCTILAAILAANFITYLFTPSSAHASSLSDSIDRCVRALEHIDAVVTQHVRTHQ